MLGWSAVAVEASPVSIRMSIALILWFMWISFAVGDLVANTQCTRLDLLGAIRSGCRVFTVFIGVELFGV